MAISSTKATRRRWLRLVVIGALAVTTTAAVPSTSGAQEAPPPPPPPAVRPDKATADGALRGRDPAPKPAESTVPPGYSSSALRLKFREGTGVRLRGGRFLSSSGADVSAVEDVLAGVTGLRRDRLMAAPEEEVADATALAERRSGRRQADLNLYYRLQVPPGTDAPALLDALNALDVVELAYAEPLPVPPPSPSFVSMQGYRGGAPGGIGVDGVGAVAGSRGGRVKVVDLEYNWNVTHEDLAKAGQAGAFIPNGTFHDPFNSTDHGTAVLGELTGDPDAQGVTGLVPDAAIGFVNQSNVERGAGDIANAIFAAVQRMLPGDVLLIEAQVPGANGGCGQDQVGCVAVEWLPDIYDAVVFATSRGIIVVEAAGNGNQNLDAANYGNPFPRGRRDSGAIIVGAGGAPNCATNPSGPRARATFSSYGRRVNLQGWGECVTTTGYGHLQGGNPNAWYTSTFGGTSSASPIVAGAAAALSSAFEQGTGSTMLSWQARSRLRATGTAQDTSVAGQIGPLPDLTRALTQPMTAPANDRFANATVIGGTTGATRTTTGRNLWSSFEGGEPFHAGVRGGSTSWFTWVAPATGTAAIDTSGSTFDTVLAVYQGNSVSALTPRASNDDVGTGVQSAVSLPVTEGTTYRIAVDGFDGAMGNITLHTGVPGAPVANAGPDASAAANAAFFLDARNSTDPQGNPLTFAWTRLSGPAVVIETPNAGRTRVSGNHADGTVMTFRVTVSDNAGNRDTDTVTITTGSSK